MTDLQQALAAIDAAAAFACLAVLGLVIGSDAVWLVGVYSTLASCVSALVKAS